MKDLPGLSVFPSRMDSPNNPTDILPQQDSLVKMPDSIQLTFINDKENIRWLSAGNAARHRHSIFTDFERRDMSLRIVSSIPYHNISRAIDDLEKYETGAECLEPFSLFRGPFGAFRWSQQSDSDSPLSESPLSKPGELAHLSEEWLVQLNELPLNENITYATFPLDVTDTDFFDDFVLDESAILPPEHIDMHYWEPKLQPSLSLSLDAGNMEGWTLLSYYRDRIVPLISPLRHGQETPWMSLAIPCAVTTLREIGLNDSANHGRLALLNAVWSTSAFHLGNHSTAGLEQWKISAEQYLQRAQYHLQKCMENICISSTKTSKYKEVLMAILSLSNAFMIKGDANKRRAWLVQTEKFIRIKGFNQPTLSSKRRALHHCYAYMRIMAETTCIAATLNINMNASMGTTGSTDTGDFRIYTKQAFSEATMLMDKDPEMAQRDLHLAIPGRWTATLFPSVYGVDEVFLLLLSQVIRLANERDMSIMTTDTSKVNMSLKEFWTLAKELESAIDHLLLPTTTNPVLGHNDRLLTESTRTAQAMYTALSIFFHRRIYEIDPIMLQGKVNDIRVCLTRAQQEEEGQSDCRSAGLIWPAFIAACEAVTPELQAFFVSWFECCVRKTALVQASGAKKIVETIWKKRSEPNQHGETCSWPDFLRDGAIKFTCV